MRKLLLFLGLILIYPAFAQGQGYLVTDIALNQNGRPIPSPTVTVCAAGQTSVPCTSLVSVFSNAALTTPVANPLPICTQTFQIGCADVYGNYSFYITPGTYTYTITGHGTALQGPFVITVPCVVGAAGCSGGGTVGPGTPNQLAKFATGTTVGDSSCTDDGTNPTRCPNGMNTAAGGFYAEWVVDTGGVTANHLACRSSNNKAVICPAGTTQGVLGVAQATVLAGGTALVCFAGKCNVVSSNATTAGHWLIPSTSINGDVDDTGSTTKPTTGVQSLPAETSVSGGNAVLTTFLSPDTLNASSGTGTITPCTINGITYYTAGTTLNCITPPTANGNYQVNYNVSGGVSVPPTASLPGIVTRSVAGTTDTILYSDRVGCVKYTSGSAVTVTVPQAGTTGFTSNSVFCLYVSGVGTVTITPTTSTLTTYNGSSVNTGPLTLRTGEWVAIHSPDNVNYDARMFRNQGTTGTIAGSWVNIQGASYTVNDSDNGNRLRFTTAGGVAITLPQPGTVTTSPIVNVRVQANAQGVNPFVSSAFAEVAGNQMWVSIQENDNKVPTSVTTSVGDNCPLQSATNSTNAIYTFYCGNLIGGASVTLTVNFSGTPGGATGVFAIELTGTTHDNSLTSAASGFTTQTLTNPVHFANAVSMMGAQNGNVPAPPWVQLDTLTNANIGTAYYRLLANNNSVSVTNVLGHSIAQTILSISNHVSFTAGWIVTMENPTTSYQTVTSTSSSINSQTTKVLAPNEACTFMSNGTNWDAVCGSIPNITNNGVPGATVITYGRDQTSVNAAVTDTLMTQPDTNRVYRFAGTVNCTTTSGGATATLNLKYTDTSNTAQTVSSTATCTALGASSVAHVDQTIRAKAGIGVTYGVTIANTPTYDVSVRLEQM